jgi:hypothetical protein
MQPRSLSEKSPQARFGDSTERPGPTRNSKGPGARRAAEPRASRPEDQSPPDPNSLVRPLRIRDPSYLQQSGIVNGNPRSPGEDPAGPFPLIGHRNTRSLEDPADPLLAVLLACTTKPGPCSATSAPPSRGRLLSSARPSRFDAGAAADPQSLAGSDPPLMRDVVD